VLWSLRTRYWAWRVAANDPLPSPDIQIFAIYQRGNANRALPDSVGLTKGLYAIANLYADPQAAGERLFRPHRGDGRIAAQTGRR